MSAPPAFAAATFKTLVMVGAGRRIWAAVEAVSSCERRRLLSLPRSVARGGSIACMCIWILVIVLWSSWYSLHFGNTRIKFFFESSLVFPCRADKVIIYVALIMSWNLRCDHESSLRWIFRDMFVSFHRKNIQIFSSGLTKAGL